MSNGSDGVDLRSALESIACLASEGPEVYEATGRPRQELFAEIATVAGGALAARRPSPAVEVRGVVTIFLHNDAFVSLDNGEKLWCPGWPGAHVGQRVTIRLTPDAGAGTEGE